MFRIEQTHYIYALVNPTHDGVFYIGCTQFPEMRKREHCDHAFTPKTPVQRHIASLKAQGIAPVFEVIEVLPKTTGREARRVESRIIREKRSKGAHLYNGKQGATISRNTPSP